MSLAKRATRKGLRRAMEPDASELRQTLLLAGDDERKRWKQGIEDELSDPSTEQTRRIILNELLEMVGV